MESHLLQMRGLKQPCATRKGKRRVASFTDAWIETILALAGKDKKESHLLQMRGLKLNGVQQHEK